MIDVEEGGFELAAWDWDFYSEKVRQERYAFDEAELKPYLELDSVLQDGVFYAASQIFGVTFEERSIWLCIRKTCGYSKSSTTTARH